MKEAFALLVGFAFGASVVVLVGKKILDEIQKIKTEMDSALDRIIRSLQNAGTTRPMEKHPIAGGNPAPIGEAKTPAKA